MRSSSSEIFNMRLFFIGLLLCCVLSLTASQERVVPDEEAAIRQADQQAKQIQRKHTLEASRKRRKYKRPTSSSASSNTTSPSKKEDDPEYTHRVRTFASAIKDTDTFLKFLKQEESKHLGNYIRSRGFNFNNRTLTTRFLQTPPPITNEISNAVYDLLPKELKHKATSTPKPTAQSYSIFYNPSAFTAAKPTTKKPTTTTTTTTTSTPRPFDADDEVGVRVPNRGLVPPLPSFDEHEVAVIAVTSASLTVTDSDTSNERRAPLPVKKASRGPKYRMPERYLRKPDDEYDEIQLTVAETAYYKKSPLAPRVRMSKQYDAQQVIPGVAGKDYSVYSQPPAGSQFNCEKGSHGYYADVDAGCQVFYICTGDGRGEPMLCPNGTLFNQQVLVCDWWFNVVCN